MSWNKSEQVEIVTTKFDRPAQINPDALADQIKELLPDKYISMDTDPERIIVRFKTDVTSADKDAVNALIESHDHTALSKEQQRQRNRADAFTRIVELDIDAIDAEKDSGKQVKAILAALRDLQLIMRGSGNG